MCWPTRRLHLYFQLIGIFHMNLFRLRSFISRPCQCPHGHIHFNVPSTCDYWLSTLIDMANRIDWYYIHGNTNKKNKYRKIRFAVKKWSNWLVHWYILNLGYMIFVWQVASMHRAKQKKCCFFTNKCESLDYIKINLVHLLHCWLLVVGVYECCLKYSQVWILLLVSRFFECSVN